MKIIYNGLVVEEEALKISPLSAGFNYGEGFFTTIKVLNREPENFDLHLNRVRSSIKYFSFEFELPDLRTEIESILSLNNLTDARIKITIFKDIDKISYIIFCSKLEINNSPVELTLSEYIRGNDPIFRYKSLNYYQNLKSALTIYRDHKNRILETGFANIFLQIDNKIYTPPTSLPILPGTFRQRLLNRGTLNGTPISEKELFIEDLKTCENIFITNSIRGITPVSNSKLEIYK